MLGDRCVVVWDNGSGHKSEMVLKLCEKEGVKVFLLPPNTTKYLQMCVKGVNRGIKANARAEGASELSALFHEYMERCKEWVQAGQPVLPFNSPLPLL